MKVLKEGKWSLLWSVEAVCKTCEAAVLVEESDVKPTYDKSNKFYWVCSVCGKDNDLPAADVVLRVRETVEKKRKYRSYSSWD